MEKYGFVYLWFDRKYKRYYIGSHWGTENDGYVCSSTLMREAFNVRPHDFRRRILTKIYTNRKATLVEEQLYLDKIGKEEFGEKYYNISSKSYKRSWWVNEKTKKVVCKKISEANYNRKGEKRSEIARQNMKIPKSEEMKAKLRKPKSEQTKQKMRGPRPWLIGNQHARKYLVCFRDSIKEIRTDGN